MTVYLYPDDARTLYWEISGLSAATPPVTLAEINLYGSWYEAVLDTAKRVASLNVCGTLVIPTPPGYVSIPTDVLPRVRLNGKEIHTDQWIRTRAVT